MRESMGLYLMPVPAREEIREEVLLTFPKSRREKIRAMKHPPSAAASYAAGLLMRDVLGITSDEQIRVSREGKPYLVSGEAFFSVSHSEKLAVLAVAPEEVGADTETYRKMSEALIRRVFRPEERQTLAGPDEEKKALRLWTRLEAALKLTGEGINGIERRSFSLLDAGRPYYYHTILWGDSVVSAACRRSYGVNISFL